MLGDSSTYSAFTIQMTTLFSEGGQSLLKAKNGHCFIETVDHQKARISKEDAADILRTGGSLTAGEKLQWTISMYRNKLK